MVEQLKTGTTTVGIVCSDGVILAADKRATAGHLIVDKRAQKVHKINENIAVTIAGGVSDAQLAIKLIRAEIKLKEVRTGKTSTVKEVANLLGNLLYNQIRRMIPGIAHFLVAGRDSRGVYLYDCFPDGSVTQIRDFFSSGSGSVFALGVLETQFKEGLSVNEGADLAKLAINTSLKRDSASGNGIDIISIKSDGIKNIVNIEIEPKL